MKFCFFYVKKAKSIFAKSVQSFLHRLFVKISKNSVQLVASIFVADPKKIPCQWKAYSIKKTNQTEQKIGYLQKQQYSIDFTASP